MNEANQLPRLGNVTLTLAPRPETDHQLSGKRFPCCLCGAALEIRISRKQKPYTVCLSCGVQTFFRGKLGIERLSRIVNSELFLTATGSSRAESAVILFNRIQQLSTKRSELAVRQRRVVRNMDLENTLCAIDDEIKLLQGELARLREKTHRRRSK
jgi:hypothetical protein